MTKIEPTAAVINERTITGRIWVICPVNSNTITDVDIVWVTAPAIAAAPKSK